LLLLWGTTADKLLCLRGFDATSDEELQQDTTRSLLLSNLRLLDIVSPDAILTPQIISSESTLHALFHTLSHDDTAKVPPAGSGWEVDVLGILALLANLRSFAD